MFSLGNALGTPNFVGYRGVSAPSFRDGAILFCKRLEKQGSHRGHGEHREKIFVNALGTPNFSLACLLFFLERSQARHRGVSDPSFRDGAIPFL